MWNYLSKYKVSKDFKTTKVIAHTPRSTIIRQFNHACDSRIS